MNKNSFNIHTHTCTHQIMRIKNVSKYLIMSHVIIIKFFLECLKLFSKYNERNT